MNSAEIAWMFPDGRKRVSGDYTKPDFDRVLSSMKLNRHFTIQQAWGKYMADPASSGK